MLFFGAIITRLMLPKNRFIKFHKPDIPDKPIFEKLLVLNIDGARKDVLDSVDLPVIEKLKKEGYRFRLLLCENMNIEEIREKLVESEIVVDQLLSRGHGLFAVEAMASGNVVLNHATPGLYGYSNDLPVITSDPDTIYDNFKMVLENPALRLEKARLGRAYVEKHHDHVAVARKLLTQIGELTPQS